MGFLSAKVLLAVLVVMQLDESSETNNLLDLCDTTSTNSIGKDIRTAWLKLGQFYSYCMQWYTVTQKIPSRFDKTCARQQCKQCMRACNNPKPFDLHQCECDCGTSDECRYGCRFYNYLFGEPGQGSIIPEIGNRPNTSGGEITVLSKTKSIVHLRWPEITTTSGLFSRRSNVSRGIGFSLGSVYAVSLDVDYTNRHREQVYGLTTQRYFDLSLSNICSTFGLYGQFEKQTKITFSVYPINFNGWIESERMESTDILPERISPVQNIIIETPPTISENNNFNTLTYTVTWNPPTDAETNDVINKKVRIVNQVQNCTSPVNFEAVLRLFNFASNEVDLNKYSAKVKVYNTKEDHLRGCTISVKITTFHGDCLLGSEATQTLLYEGCETIPGDSCPPVTTPKPTDAPITDRSLALIGSDCTTCQNQICTVGHNIVHVTWQKPFTLTPIKYYEIYWGQPELFFGLNVILDGSVENVTATAMSYTLNVPSDITFLGVLVSAITSSSDPPRHLNPVGFVYLNVTALNLEDLTCP